MVNSWREPELQGKDAWPRRRRRRDSLCRTRRGSSMLFLARVVAIGLMLHLHLPGCAGHAFNTCHGMSALSVTRSTTSWPWRVPNFVNGETPFVVRSRYPPPIAMIAAVLAETSSPGLRPLENWQSSALDQDERGAGFFRDLKMALAGALAGAVATAVLFPIDTAKTLRQANPKTIRSTRQALAHICRTRGPISIYTGLPTAVLGAMPSSALYFGTYEAVKTRLVAAAARVFPAGGREGGHDPKGGEGERVHPVARAAAHALAAASGNAASSLVFVPKEYVKQTLQASGIGVAGSAKESARQIVARTLRERGVRGLYRGYWATLSRNIPSAVIRFSLYEEIKLQMCAFLGLVQGSQKLYTRLLGPERLMSTPPIYLLAGALAGACASGLTTPFDVLKTRVATGSLEGGRGLANNMASIVAEEGWKGLYAGFQPRVVMSGLFTAVGFSSFETFKIALGVSPLESSDWTLEGIQEMPVGSRSRVAPREAAMIVSPPQDGPHRRRAVLHGRRLRPSTNVAVTAR